MRKARDPKYVHLLIQPVQRTHYIKPLTRALDLIGGIERLLEERARERELTGYEVSEAGGCAVEGSETCMEANVARGVASGRAGGQFKPAKKGQEIWLYLKNKEMLWRDVKQSETEINRFEKLSVVDIQTAVQKQGGDRFDGTSEEGFHSNTYRRGHCKNR